MGSRWNLQNPNKVIIRSEVRKTAVKSSSETQIIQDFNIFIAFKNKSH